MPDSSTIRMELCIDVDDVERMATFWQAALGYDQGSGHGEPYLNLVPQHGFEGPVVFLQKVSEPKTTKNRLHIDLYSAHAKQLITVLVALGAVVTGEGADGDFAWHVLLDPEGNEFCVMDEIEGTPGR